MINSKRLTDIISITFFIIILIFPFGLSAQENETQNFDRDSLITFAKEIMIETRYCALITLDTSGHPQARTMDAFPPEKDLTVWFGTNANSRKVKEIQHDSRVTLYYEAHNGAGYVTVKGQAFLVDDPNIKLKYWKQDWDKYYPNKKENYILIKVIPERMEIVDYKHGITSKLKTWAAPYIKFLPCQKN